MKTVVRLAAIACVLAALSIAGCGADSASSVYNAQGSGGAANPNATIPGPSSIQEATRSIQEADIYKLVGNTLYILSSKRGLEIVDVTDVQSPKLLSTLPTQSSPRQIYVEGETAYVLTSNVDDIDCGGYKGTCGWNAPGGVITQVDVINVGNPATPTILGTQQLPGDLQDSRIVGTHPLRGRHRRERRQHPGRELRRRQPELVHQGGRG
jgi:hypothetical protein